MRHDLPWIMYFPCRIHPDSPVKIVLERRCGAGLLGSQEFLHQRPTVRVGVRPPRPLMLDFQVLMEGEQVRDLLVGLHQIFREVDRSVLVVKGEIRGVEPRTKNNVGERRARHDALPITDDIALDRIE